MYSNIPLKLDLRGNVYYWKITKLGFHCVLFQPIQQRKTFVFIAKYWSIIQLQYKQNEREYQRIVEKNKCYVFDIHLFQFWNTSEIYFHDLETHEIQIESTFPMHFTRRQTFPQMSFCAQMSLYSTLCDSDSQTNVIFFDFSNNIFPNIFVEKQNILFKSQNLFQIFRSICFNYFIYFPNKTFDDSEYKSLLKWLLS